MPEQSAVFALYGEAANAEPYIGRTPNLRGRLERLLIPSARNPKRLQLAGRVRRIAWRRTGSDFESLLFQFNLLQEVYGAKCLERMHLGMPSFVRFLGSNRYPRLAVTNRPNLKEAQWAYGPFPSRVAAERFADEALKLFLLRRCTEELAPDPAHPGCVYSEMKMCLAPCYQGCTDERYGDEARAVERFMATRGESPLVQLREQRDAASADLEFEAAAALHGQVVKAEAVRALAAEIVRPLSELRAIILNQHLRCGQSRLRRHPCYQRPLDQCGAFGRPTAPSAPFVPVEAAEITAEPAVGLPATDSAPAMRPTPPAVGPTAPSAPIVSIEAAEINAGPAVGLTGRDSAPAVEPTPPAVGPIAPSAPFLAPEIAEGTAPGSGVTPELEPAAPEVVVFLYEGGRLRGPVMFSTLGMRIQNEQSGSSSLFAQPVAVEAVAEAGERGIGATREKHAGRPARGMLEARLEEVIEELAISMDTPDLTIRQGHLALLKRWYYRPEVKRSGEIFFPDDEGEWPLKAILRGIGRVAAKSLTGAARLLRQGRGQATKCR